MDETEKLLYNELIQIEPFVEAIFQNKLNLYEGLLSVKITFDYLNHSMLYSFPSEPSQQFRFLNASLYDEQYNETLLNYQNNISETVFSEFEVLEIC